MRIQLFRRVCALGTLLTAGTYWVMSGDSGASTTNTGSNAASSLLAYPLGSAKKCPVGWLKRTERQRVGKREVRYVACTVAADFSRHLLPASTQSVTTPGTGTLASYNWSGYVATGGGTYTSVSAEWVVPNILCSGLSPTAAVSTWVGVGGEGQFPIFQSGTESQCDEYSSTYIWWTDETHGFSPSARVSVSSGDVIYSRDWEVSPGLWQYVVADLTSGKRITSRSGVQWSGPASSAEWIQEDPGNSGIDNLADYDEVTFEHVDYVAGTPATVLTPHGIDIDHTIISQPEGLEILEGMSFTVKYLGVGG